MGFLQDNIDARMRAAGGGDFTLGTKASSGDSTSQVPFVNPDANPDIWHILPLTVQRLNPIEAVTQPLVWKGDPIVSPPFTVVPTSLIMNDPGGAVFKLGSSDVNVVGSFAPTITDEGFSYIAGTDSVTIYYDGTHGSQRIRQRRVSGYNQTLPGGFLTIQGLPSSAIGAVNGPKYDLIPFFFPGACQVSWVKGSVGTPKFAFPTGTTTPDDLNQARIRGREPIADTVITIQLQPTPVPPPPPTTPPPVDPGTQVGNTAVNGTLTTVVDYPGQAAAENISFNGSAHASDSSGKNITGWEVYLDGTKTFNYSGVAKPSISFPIVTNPGTHVIIVKGYNQAGTHADVTTNFTTSDLGGGTPPSGPPPTPPPPPPPPPPRVPPGCVILGTIIETLGPSPWHQQQSPQNDWVRIFTERGRELIGTPDHPVYTGRAGRTEMRDVRKGDFVVCIEGEEKVMEVKAFQRPGVKVQMFMDWGHLFWANGFLSHNVKPPQQ